MTVAVVVPIGITDPHRARALEFVRAWYARHWPRWPLVLGELDAGEWSKGAAVTAGVELIPADTTTLVIADADSFLSKPAYLAEAVELVEAGRFPWATPHRRVYRLREAETDRLHTDPLSKPRLGHTCRPVYEGPSGGGITAVSMDAYRLVNGIDARFLGWGGEDVAFGWALETLVGEPFRVDGALVHLWHPHPAPELRGSLESEALVALYQRARGVRRRMAALVSGEIWPNLEPLDKPVRFRLTANRTSIRLPSGAVIRFRNRIYETRDADEVEQIRRFPRLVVET